MQELYAFRGEVCVLQGKGEGGEGGERSETDGETEREGENNYIHARAHAFRERSVCCKDQNRKLCVTEIPQAISKHQLPLMVSSYQNTQINWLSNPPKRDPS